MSQTLTFDEWLLELDKEYAKYNFPKALEMLSRDEWKQYYDDDLSPKDVVLEDMSYGDINEENGGC